MKFLGGEFAYLVSEREMRGNLRALLRYLVLLVAIIATHSVVFHVIKLYVEDEQYT